QNRKPFICKGLRYFRFFVKCWGEPILPKSKRASKTVGKYGLMRERYLQEHKNDLYMSLYLSGRLTKHLLEINEQAQNQVDEVVSTMAKAEGCNEELKAKGQLK
ncbi:MAG: TnpV protein, partial [Oscillospiraceae bacterium]